MASSVSSERAFSSAGITITKRRNRLKPDIIEALQSLKCIYHRELLFREEPSTALEVEEYDEVLEASNLHNITEQVGWDGLVEDLVDDEGLLDSHDEDNIFLQDVL
jgi:hypothetical protein